IPIVALTADAMKGARQQCFDAGMDDYLTKPLDRARLAETLERHLAAGSEQAGVNPGADLAAQPAAQLSANNLDAPIDWEQFMAVADGDRQFAQELVQLFIDSGDAALRDIRAALERGDLPAVGRAAHSFKGSSANIRAPSAAAAAARLEEAARTGDADRISELERQLRDEALRAREYLRARRA